MTESESESVKPDVEGEDEEDEDNKTDAHSLPSKQSLIHMDYR